MDSDTAQTIKNLKKLKSIYNGDYSEDINKAIKALEQQDKKPQESKRFREITLYQCGVGKNAIYDCYKEVFIVTYGYMTTSVAKQLGYKWEDEV